MRCHNIVSGILLVLSIIDFALAAPVLVQEKRQAHVDEMHIPKNVMTVLGKRAGEVEKVVEFFKTALGKLFDSSGSHASSDASSAPAYENGLSDFDWYDASYGGIGGHEPMHTMSTDEPDDFGPYEELAGEPPQNPRPSIDEENGPDNGLAGGPAQDPSPPIEGDHGPHHESAEVPAPNPRPSTEGDDSPDEE